MNPTTLLFRRRGLLATCVLSALLELGCAPAAFADARLVQVDVLDRDNGTALHVWRDHGRPVIAGRPGARYAVRLVNNSGERVLAVVAIDGVNVVSGETASVGQRGYVLGPWERAEITGWRKSDDEVAAFEFTSLANSYAARTGRPDDVGVIGVAVFREAPSLDVSNAAPPPYSPRPMSRTDSLAKAAPAPFDGPTAAAAAPPEASQEARRSRDYAADAAASGRAQPSQVERLGTGHGARETSPSRVTTFQRATTQPEQRIAIRYDSLDNLIAAGIVPPPRFASTPPHAFPADPPRGFVPDPPSYR